jgi:DNA polymerase III subunit epsilon
MWRGIFRSPPWDLPTYWALDLETGGLEPRKDPILAVGMVELRGGVIRLGEHYHSLVRPASAGAIDPESIRAHQLVWGEVRDAPPVCEVLREVDLRLRQGVLLVHQAAIDVAFLRAAYRSCGMRWPRPPVVDTVDLLVKQARKARFLRPDAPDDLPSLNLGEARHAAGLPEYQAHDALGDAVATAELLLVLRRRLGAQRLRDL